MKKVISLAMVLALMLTAIPMGALAETGSTLVFINEICSSNKGENGNLTEIKDDDGDYLDWIELYNGTDSEVDLSGYGVSDKKSEPFRYTLPVGTKIAAKGFLIVYCSKGCSNPADKLLAPIGISADGEKILLTSPDSSAADIVDLPALAADRTYGRFPDGGDTFKEQNPTPLHSNVDSSEIVPNAPTFSKQSGCYTSSFSLEILSDEPNGKIYYTTDGSEPTTSETRIEYTGAITVKDRNGSANVIAAVPPNQCSISNVSTVPSASSVDKGTVIRACVESEKGVCSRSSAASYFVGSRAATYEDIPIVSVTTDYDNLFDYETGIFTRGKVYDDFKKENPTVTENWLVQMNSTQRGREWERDCHVDLIDTDGSVVISQNCGMRTMGGASRTSIQKSMRFYARADYGENYFNCELFDNSIDSNGKVIDKYKTFAVRNGGNDATYMKYTDNFLQMRVADLDFETQNGKPVLVFLNGEYYGMQIMQEDYSEEYFAQKYDLDADEVIVVKKGEVDEGVESDINSYLEMTEFIRNTNFSIEENYQKACEMLDMQSFADYMATEMYICNNDWPGNNNAFWRVRTVDETNPVADGRWRMLLFDTEYSTGMYGAAATRYDRNMLTDIGGLQTNQGALAEMFFELRRNPAFKQMFIESMERIFNISYHYDDSLAECLEMYDYCLPYLKTTVRRFTGVFNSYYGERYSQLKWFLSRRRQYIIPQIDDFFRLKSEAFELAVSTNDNSFGSVSINEAPLELDKYEEGFSGLYFPTYPVRLTATPAEGYVFVGWNGASESTEPSIEVTVTEAMSIQAVFEKAPEFIYGDSNGDGSFNAKDVLLLSQYLASWKVELDMTATDVDLDGKLTAKDLLLYRKKLAGFDVVLGK